MTSRGHVALISGASRGIGAAAAEVFVAAGWRVGLLARDGAALGHLAARLGPGALALPGDVARPEDVAGAVARLSAAFGGPDLVLCNAAVIAPISPLDTVAPEDWARAVEVNLLGTFHLIRAALPGMLAKGGGTILSLSSGAAHRPLPGWSAYCATKAAAAMLLRSVHLEHGAAGIRAFGLSPGTVATDMQREIRASGVGPVADLDWSEHIPPDWPARALLWLAGPEAEDLRGTEISLRDPEMRRRIGLPV